MTTPSKRLKADIEKLEREIKKAHKILDEIGIPTDIGDYSFNLVGRLRWLRDEADKADVKTLPAFGNLFGA